ncbi:MAG: Xaa-Pro peptidase family protein [bacterium]
MTAKTGTPGLDSRAFLMAKTDQAIEILKEKGIDCWLTYVRESLANSDPSLELIYDGDLTWESALILTADGEKIAIVGVHDAPDIEDAAIFSRVIGYREGISEPLVNTLSRLDPHAIAVNLSENDPLADGLGAGLYKLLQRRLGGTLFGDLLMPAEDVLWSLRARKLPMEVDALRRAARETIAILEDAGKSFELGMTASDVAHRVQQRTRERGLGFSWTPKMCPIVNVGAGSPVGHVTPRGDAIVPGCAVRLDFGVKVDGYCADLQRMWWISRNSEGPPEPVAHAFATIVDAIGRAAEALRPGVKGGEIDEIAREVIRQAGYDEFQHALGHQLGRAPHDGGGAQLAPRWERYNETPYRQVETNSVFTLEPSIALPEYGTIALEEMVLVGEKETEFLTPRQTELPVLDLG